MTNARYTYSFYDINMATLRFWGDKPAELIDILHFDTPIGWDVYEGWHTKALSRDINFVNEDGEPIHEDIPRFELQDLMSKLCKAFAEGNKSYCVAGMFDFEDGHGERFYFIAPKYITDMHLVPGKMELDPTKPFVFNNPIRFVDDGVSEPITVEGTALQKLFLIGNYDRDIGQFRNRYESITDNLVGLSILDQQLVLLVIRVGSGVRYIIAPVSYMSESGSRAKFKSFLQNLGMNSLLVVPQSSDGDQFEFKLDFGEGTPPFDWSVSRSNLLRGVALRLGKPERVMNGNEIGLRGSESDEAEYLRNLDLEALHWERYILKAVSLQFDVEFADTDRIDYGDFVQPDEGEQVELFGKKITILKGALDIMERAGMPLEWILEQLGFDYDIDQALIAQYEQRIEMERQALNDQMTKGSQGSNGKHEEGKGRTNPQLQAKQ